MITRGIVAKHVSCGAYWVKNLLSFSSVLLVFVLITGCITVPTMKKVDMLPKQSGYPFTIDANYLVLARYWDDYAEKQMIDFKGASFLTIREDEGRAEITIGNGPYYGMIELKKLTETSTSVTPYGWGGLEGKINEWTELLRRYPSLRR